MTVGRSGVGQTPPHHFRPNKRKEVSCGIPLIRRTMVFSSLTFGTKKARVFVPRKFIKASLVFEGKTGAYPL